MLTHDDLDKIKAVVDSRVDLLDVKFERRLADLESRMATKDDLKRVEVTMATKEQLDQIKEMLVEDYKATNEDVADLQIRVTALEAR